MMLCGLNCVLIVVEQCVCIVYFVDKVGEYCGFGFGVEDCEVDFGVEVKYDLCLIKG